MMYQSNRLPYVPKDTDGQTYDRKYVDRCTDCKRFVRIVAEAPGSKLCADCTEAAYQA